MNRLLIFLLGVATGAAILTCVRLLGVGDAAIERRATPPPAETSGFVTRARDDEPPPRPMQPITGVVPARDASSSAAPAPAREAAELAGSITGSIRRPDGTPAEGVLVRATANPGNRPSKWELNRRGDGPPADLSVDAMTEEFLKGVAAERAARREAISDAAGKYALTELGTGAYYVRAWLPGHDVDPVKSTSSVRAGAVVDFVARPVVRVPVKVLLPDGGQPEVATIMITTGRGGNYEIWRPEWGEIRCLPGSWSMSATVGDDRQYRSEPQDVVVKADAAPEPIVFQLKERPGIKGRLLGVPAESFSELRIFALRYVGDPPDDARVIDQGTREVPHGTADCDFALSDLEEGRYLIGVVWGDRPADTDKKLAARVSVDVKGLIRQDLTVPPDDSKAIILWVLGPDGTPQQDADLSITIFASANGSSTSSARASKRADGSMRLAMPSMKSRDRKDVLAVQTQKFGTKRVEVDWDREQTLTVKFDEPATLTVTIPNYPGSRHQGAVTLSLMLVEDQKSSRGSSQTYSGPRLSPEGRQTFSGLQPGSYELALFVSSVRAAAIPVTLVGGSNSVSLPIPPLFRVTVAAGEEYRGGNVFTQAGKSEGRSLHASIGDDGQAVFETVPPGEYVFTLSSSKGFGKTKSLTIAADAVVRFEPGEIKTRGESPR